MQKKCPKCFDLGKEGGCPLCGKKKELTNPLSFTKSNDEKLIPTYYRGKIWEPPVDIEANDIQTTNFIKALSKIHESCVKNGKLSFSCYIATNTKIDIFTLAYSCMQGLLLHKKTVSPILSTADMRRLLKISQINPFFKLFGELQYDKVIDVDYLFLTVSHMEDYRYTDIPLLKEILDTRSRLGLPTIIISDYCIEDLVPKWNSKIYLDIYNTSPNRDVNRFPVIIQNFKYNEE